MWNLQKCDVYKEVCFSQKRIFTNGLNIGLPPWARVEKLSMEGKHTDAPVKENIPGVAI